MEQLNGLKINVLPFRNISKVSDLISFEGPVLSHFKDAYGKDILFYWIDYNDIFNRWLVFQVSQTQLYHYLGGLVPLRELIENPLNDVYFTVEIGESLDYNNITQIFEGDLNAIYIPEADSIFRMDVPIIYQKRLAQFKESFLIESFLEKAVFAKAEPSELNAHKNHNLVSVIGSANLLWSYGTSYKGYLNNEVRREFYLRGIYDNKRIQKAVRQVVRASQLNVVKSEAASFAVAFSPNNITSVDEGFLNKDWRDKVFNQFKNDVIDIDKMSEVEVDQIIKEYGEESTYSIYKPIIDLYNNKELEIKITDRDFKPTRQVHRIKDEIVRKLTKDKTSYVDEPIERLALVKFNTSTGKITGTSQATLFDQSIQTSWATDQIQSEKKTFRLKHTLFAAYHREQGVHIIEHDVLNIFASGVDLPEAETNFSTEFFMLYEKLSNTEIENLESDDIKKKEFLRFYISI
jgi:hypothetical protein